MHETHISQESDRIIISIIINNRGAKDVKNLQFTILDTPTAKLIRVRLCCCCFLLYF